MAYDLNSLIRMKDLKVLAQMIKAELQNSGGGSGGGSIEWPDSDDKYYAAKNGAWVEVTPAIMIETETAALPADKYPLRWKKILDYNSSTFFGLPSPFQNKVIFSYEGKVYLLHHYDNGNSRSNRAFCTSATSWKTLDLGYITQSQLYMNNLKANLLQGNFLYMIINNTWNKLYRLNLSDAKPTPVEISALYTNIDTMKALCYSPTLDRILVVYGKGVQQSRRMQETEL